MNSAQKLQLAQDIYIAVNHLWSIGSDDKGYELLDSCYELIESMDTEDSEYYYRWCEGIDKEKCYAN